MSRAYNIHVVLFEGNVVAAFTVKRELETWLIRWDPEGQFEVITVKDNPPQPQTSFGSGVRST